VFQTRLLPFDLISSVVWVLVDRCRFSDGQNPIQVVILIDTHVYSVVVEMAI
jgi:hypothetical protein